MAWAAAVLFSGIGAESVTTVSQLIRNPPPKPLRTAVDSQRQDRPNEDRAAPEESRGAPIN